MSKSIETRLDKLEVQHAGPVRIWVTIGDEGIYKSNGETLTRAELDARYADEDVTVFKVVQVDYVEMSNLERIGDNDGSEN